MISALGIWVVRKEAEELGRFLEVKLGGHLGGLDCAGGESNRAAFASRCATYRQWVLVMTTGIAVRYLAELIKDKRTDPGVVVIDEGCRFAVSLLGGHEGGANDLAYRVANLTAAVPVVTTATEALKPLVVGLGCRKGTPADLIDAAIQRGPPEAGANASGNSRSCHYRSQRGRTRPLGVVSANRRAVTNNSADAYSGAAMDHQCVGLGA